MNYRRELDQRSALQVQQQGAEGPGGAAYAHLQMLSEKRKKTLHTCFEQHADGHRAETDDTWDTAEVNFIPKCKNPATPSQFRSIVTANHTKKLWEMTI